MEVESGRDEIVMESYSDNYKYITSDVSIYHPSNSWVINKREQLVIAKPERFEIIPLNGDQINRVSVQEYKQKHIASIKQNSKSYYVVLFRDSDGVVYDENFQLLFHFNTHISPIPALHGKHVMEIDPFDNIYIQFVRNEMHMVRYDADGKFNRFMLRYSRHENRAEDVVFYNNSLYKRSGYSFYKSNPIFETECFPCFK